MKTCKDYNVCLTEYLVKIRYKLLRNSGMSNDEIIRLYETERFKKRILIGFIENHKEEVEAQKDISEYYCAIQSLKTSNE